MSDKMLETTIVSLARQKLTELRSFIANPVSNEDMMRHDISHTFTSITQLAEIALFKNSGLSEEGVSQLLDIDKEKCAAVRTFKWMFDRN